MPLINFRTNLTSLRYGSDRPGGGSSGQPFIQFPIEDANTPPQFKRYYEANRTGLDFPVRGGAISQLIADNFGIISSTIDRQRIEKFFNSAPRGTAFIEKQKGLQLTNPRMQVPNALVFAGESIGNVFLPVTNVYASTNTLAQVQVMGTGTFFNRHGYSPTIFESPQRTYAYIAGAPQNNTEVTNRLAILKATKLLNSTTFLPKGIGGSARGIDPTLIERMGISQFQDQIFNYVGGPGSVYGIGTTRIFRASNTKAAEIPASQIKDFTVNGATRAYSAIALTYQQLAEQTTRDGRAPVMAKIQDFRAQTNNGSPIIPYSDYEKFNIASTAGTNIGIGNPGAPNARISYTITSTVGEDRLNMFNPFVQSTTSGKDFYYNPSETTPWTVVGAQSNDMIKFAFECIDNDESNATVPLIFRAFLEGQITDTNQAEYNTFKYLGRGETFRTYQGFDRTIGFSFKVFVQSRQEMLPVYTKLNALISQVYPDYSAKYNLMRGNVVRLTIGDYLYRVPGFLENVNVTIDNTNTPWEIVLNQYRDMLFEEDDVRQLPHMVNVQCSFKPIMDLLPRKVTKSNPFVPLIVNGDHFIDPEATNADLRNAFAYPNIKPLAPSVGVQTNTQVTTQNAYGPIGPPELDPSSDIRQQRVAQINAKFPGGLTDSEFASFGRVFNQFLTTSGR